MFTNRNPLICCFVNSNFNLFTFGSFFENLFDIERKIFSKKFFYLNNFFSTHVNRSEGKEFREFFQPKLADHNKTEAIRTIYLGIYILMAYGLSSALLVSGVLKVRWGIFMHIIFIKTCKGCWSITHLWGFSYPIRWKKFRFYFRKIIYWFVSLQSMF